MTASPTLLSQQVCFGGSLEFYQHSSNTCNSTMKFAVYQPPQARSEVVPVLYFLSGLTCSDENFMIKAGAQRYAADHGLMLVAPDTSPRNTGIPQEAEEWDLGSGASFYVNATQEPWAAHYQMYSYITEELPALMEEHFPVRADRQGIFGHSMGGHGALICALRNRDRFRSVSAFAPIAAPSQSPWGQKAFSHYLGTDAEAWKAYDASELVLTAGYNRPILIDQGTADPFLSKGQLQLDLFEAACTQAGQPLTLRRQGGYDHSYYFIATFMGDHIQHHAAVLCR
ncbi:S-formylglutathione hydrolase [Prochlorothrix hollandica]|uniref:S-formylglutathione hydrolase n=1 Tax=Prochlorothrix hollandica PCC 9006 = CALU 1027 TaxID=317619 RepID=A0A0M2PYI9_PROHO|nr:S-formylglutathione hydrolase [Prochlorothrix hollandica]KKI99446.1 S-formylglutathione hydrolase [Prochlorothrix hollandica PCC 9006 = CALU 1027]